MPNRPPDPVAGANPALVEVVFVGQLPPPVHGQSLTDSALAYGTYSRIRVSAIPLGFSDDIASVGRFQLKKLLRIPALIWAVIGQWRAGHRDVLVYSLGAKNLIGVARDLMVLPFIRPLFRRTVLYVHTGGMRPLYSRPGLSLLARLGYGGADTVIHIDKLVAGRDDLLPKPKKIAFLHAGMPDPTSGVLAASRGAGAVPVIVFVGNLYPSKGTHHLIRAAGILAARGHRFEVRFVGAPPTPTTNAALTALAQNLDIDDRVQLVGALPADDVWTELGRADIFCFPTHYEAEAFPRVLIEAMVAGLPVVSTHWRAVPAIVDDNVTGFLVEPDDDKALADRLETLITDPALARTMGDAGRARYEANFTLARFEADFEQIVLAAANS